MAACQLAAPALAQTAIAESAESPETERRLQIPLENTGELRAGICEESLKRGLYAMDRSFALYPR